MATLAGTTINIVNDSIKIEWVPKIDWEILSNGNHYPFELGGADRYYTTFEIRGTRTQCQQTDYALGTLGRGVANISYSSGEPIWGPGAHDAVTSVSCESRPTLRRLGLNYWALSGIRLLALDGGAPQTIGDIDIMQLIRNSYDPNTGIDCKAQVAADLTTTIMDQQVDVGTFRARMRNSDADFAAIYSSIVSYRGDSIQFPDIQGITYPFGTRGASDGGNCRIRSIENIKRVGLEWEYDITLVQEL